MLLIVLMPVTQAVEIQGVGNASKNDLSVSVQESKLASLKNTSGFLVLEPVEPVSESSFVLETESAGGEVDAQASNYNTCGESKYMNVGESISLYIDHDKDVDWFKWYLPTGGKLKVDLAVPFPKDYDLELYTGCTKLECKSDSGLQGNDETCTFTIPSAGWVYAKVYGYRGDYSTTKPYTIKGTLQSASVDLVAESLVAEPGTVYENEPFILHANFRNTGQVSVNQYFVNDLYLNGALWKRCANDPSKISIQPDRGYECAYENLQLSAGTYTLKQVVDAQNHVQESSESNNAREASLVVVKRQVQYDLYAQPLVVTPANPYDTSQITVQGGVKNNGAGVGSSFTNRLYVDGILYKPCSVSSLASGSSSLCSYSGRFAAGEHLVRFYVDADQLISETNEGNNYQEYTFSVQRDSSQDYDLIVTDIWSSITPRAEEPFSLSFSVDNIRQTSINRVFNNKLYVDGNVVGGCTANYLLDGNVFTCPVPGIILGAGTHTVKAVADADDAVAEVNNDNNAREESLIVAAPVLPDIVVGSLWTEPDALLENQQFIVKYTLTNVNDGIVSRSFVANLYIDGGHHSSCSIPLGLAKGNNYPCSASVGGLITGSHTLRVVADAGGVVAESVEINNEKSKSIIVNPKPCPVPDGSRYCDCNYHSDCPAAYPYCQDAYPAPISDGYDACLSKPPLYCGDGSCNNWETWQSCSADCPAPQGRVYVDVKNQQRNPVTGAFVYLDDSFKGTTSGMGKIDFSSSYGNRNVKILCPDQSYCSTKSVAVDGNEYVGFPCGCVNNQQGDLEVYVYNQNNYPLVNVIGYLDGNEIGLSNPFGLIKKERVPYGNHNLRLEMYVAKYDPIKKGEYSQTISISQSKRIEKIVLRESDLRFIDTLYHIDAYGNVIAQNSSEQIVFLAAIPIVMEIVDIASVTYSATEFCKCAYDTDQLIGGAQECFNTLSSCSASGFNAGTCLNGVQAFSSAKDKCFAEAAFLVGDVASPLIPVGLIGGVIIKTGRKFSWVDNAFRWVGKEGGKWGKEAWSYTKKLGDYVVTFIAKNSDKGITRSIPLGRLVLQELDDEAFEGLQKIITKGGIKSADGLVEYLGEEGAKKLGRNIGKLSKKNIKGFDDLNKELGKFGKLYEEGKLANNANAVKGAAGNLKGLIFEAEVAAHPKYIDEVAEIRKPLTKNEGEIDVLLKDGTIIEAKSRSFPLHSDAINKIAEQARKYSLEDPKAKIKFLVKKDAPDYPVKLMNEEIVEVQKYVKQKMGIDIIVEVFEP